MPISSTNGLRCNILTNYLPQTDCRTYSLDGKLTYANRYAIRSFCEDIQEIKDSFNNAKIFTDFVNLVNSQNHYNKNGLLKAIPLVTYHNVDLTINKPYTTNVNLFAEQMKYLHDNGFKVVTMANLGFDSNSNTVYIK